MKNKAHSPKYRTRTSYFIFHAFLALLLAVVAVSPPMAQQASTPKRPSKMPEAVPAKPDSIELKNTYIFAGLGAFIPTGQSYMQNYSTNIAGLPVELSGGLYIPVTNNLGIPLTIRYVRRVANFVPDGSIEVLSIEPGVRVYLERQRNKELRLFGAVSILLTRATVSGDYDVSTTGPVTGTALAEPSYLDIGIGVDLGFSYPLTQTTALDAAVHIALYFASPVYDGGLGNIGGVSLCGSYRFGF